jgi:hypothetical protein
MALAHVACMSSFVERAKLIRKGELEACASVTRLQSNNRPDEGERHYEGMLVCDVRVGTPLVLVANGRRRLVTSSVRRIEPISRDVVYVETSNSRYHVRRLVGGAGDHAATR